MRIRKERYHAMQQRIRDLEIQMSWLPEYVQDRIPTDADIRAIYDTLIGKSWDSNEINYHLSHQLAWDILAKAFNVRITQPDEDGGEYRVVHLPLKQLAGAA